MYYHNEKVLQSLDLFNELKRRELLGNTSS